MGRVVVVVVVCVDTSCLRRMSARYLPGLHTHCRPCPALPCPATRTRV